MFPDPNEVRRAIQNFKAQYPDMFSVKKEEQSFPDWFAPIQRYIEERLNG